MNKEKLNQSKKKKQSDNVPDKIAEYIKDNFEGGFLSNIERVKDKNGKAFYNVEISHDNNLYRMKFNSNGALLTRIAEPLLELLQEDDYLDMD